MLYEVITSRFRTFRMNHLNICRRLQLISRHHTFHQPRITSYNVCYTKLLRAFDYIKKPFNRTELMARVKSALKLSEANKQLLEIEKKATFVATIVTANHKIKQPLTLLSLSSAAIKKELENVITSYSIHYTKLYEHYLLIRQ